MAVNGQRFCEEIGNVEQARDVPYPEVPLADPIAEPVQSHVYRLRALGGYGVCGEADRALIVNNNVSRGLGAPDVGKDVSFIARDFAASKSARVLCFENG